MSLYYVFMLLYVSLGFNSRSFGLLLVLISSYGVIAGHTASMLTSGEEKVKKKKRKICLIFFLAVIRLKDLKLKDFTVSASE